MYRQVLDNIALLDERSVWVHATALNACLVLGDEVRQQEHLEQLRALRPTKEQQASIHRGLTTVAGALNIDERVVRFP